MTLLHVDFSFSLSSILTTLGTTRTDTHTLLEITILILTCRLFISIIILPHTPMHDWLRITFIDLSKPSHDCHAGNYINHIHTFPTDILCHPEITLSCLLVDVLRAVVPYTRNRDSLCIRFINVSVSVPHIHAGKDVYFTFLSSHFLTNYFLVLLVLCLFPILLLPLIPHVSFVLCSRHSSLSMSYTSQTFIPPIVASVCSFLL